MIFYTDIRSNTTTKNNFVPNIFVVKKSVGDIFCKPMAAGRNVRNLF